MIVSLSKNFSLHEFTRSQTAARAGRPIVADKKQVNNLVQLVRCALQPLRDLVQRPIVITSGVRPEWLNTSIGGSKNSQHIKGQAADLVVPGMSAYEVCEKAIEAGIPFDQLIHEFGEWVHISYVSKNRSQVLTAKSSDGRTVYSQGLNA